MERLKILEYSLKEILCKAEKLKNSFMKYVCECAHADKHAVFSVNYKKGNMH